MNFKRSTTTPALGTKTGKKTKTLALLVVLVLVIGVLGFIFIQITSFYNRYTFDFQKPIIIRTPVVLVNREKEDQKELERLVEVRVKAELKKQADQSLDDIQSK